MNIQSIKSSRADYILLGLASIAYCLFIFRYGINIPVMDDYGQQLSRVIKLDSGEFSVFDFLFNLHNGHRIFTTLIFSLIEYWGFGSINIKTQLLLSAGLLVCLSFTLVSLATKEHRLIASIVCCSILFVPNYAASLWLGGSTPYFSLVLFGVLSLKILPRIDRKNSLVLSILFSFLAMYSLLSGFLVAVVGVIYLFFCGNRIGLKSKLLWASSNMFFLLLYFQNYKSSSSLPSVLAAFEMPVFTLEFTGQFLSGFWVYLVGQKFLPVITFLATVFFIWAVFIKIGFKRFLEQDLSLPLIYLVLLCASVIAGRVGFNSLDITISAKYFVFTKTLWILSIFLLLNVNVIKPVPTMVLVIPFFCYFVIGYSAQIGGMRDNQKQLSQAMVDALFAGDHSKLRNPRKDKAHDLLTTALDRGIYRPQLLTSNQITSVVSRDEPSKAPFVVDNYSIKQIYDYIIVEFELKERPGLVPIVSFQKGLNSPMELYTADDLMWRWGEHVYRVTIENRGEQDFVPSKFSLINEEIVIPLNYTN